MTRWLRYLLCTIVLSSVACGSDVVPPPMPGGMGLGEVLREAPAATGEAVATVDGKPIPLAVAARQVAQGRSGDQVIGELVNAELLYPQAVEKGYLEDPRVLEAYKRAMVERYLATAIEDRHRPEDVALARVRKYYAENEYLYYTPALRAADHLLVKPSSAKWTPQKNWDDVPKEVFSQAAKFAGAIHRDVTGRQLKPKSAGDLEALKARWSSRLPDTLEIVVERLPVSSQRAFGTPGKPGFINAMVDPFADAMFAMPSMGVLSEPVDTLFGTHLLVVTEMVAEQRVPDAQAHEGIREYLAQEDRSLAMATLLRQLISGTVIRADESLLIEGPAPAPAPAP